MQEKIRKLQKIYDNSNNIVFFGGAGVSTESGIKDFRSEDGLYREKFKYSPEYMLSISCFNNDPLEFFKFYKEKILVDGILPNKAHEQLAKMEKAGKLKAVITQNIDGLHQSAGSQNVIEIHGSVLKNYCEDCLTRYDLDFIKEGDGVPKCKKCGGSVRPDVVLYGEGLDDVVWQKAIRAVEAADTLIVAGTSLVVYPAAYIVDYFKGRNLVIINLQKTSEDNYAALIIRNKVGQVLGELKV